MTGLQVSEEYVACQARECPLRASPGALVLSEFAGCAQSLAGAVRVNPWSPEDVAAGLLRALTMSDGERRSAWESLHTYVCDFTSQHWAASFVAAMRDVAAENSAAAATAAEVRGRDATEGTATPVATGGAGAAAAAVHTSGGGGVAEGATAQAPVGAAGSAAVTPAVHTHDRDASMAAALQEMASAASADDAAAAAAAAGGAATSAPAGDGGSAVPVVAAGAAAAGDGSAAGATSATPGNPVRGPGSFATTPAGIQLMPEAAPAAGDAHGAGMGDSTAGDKSEGLDVHTAAAVTSLSGRLQRAGAASLVIADCRAEGAAGSRASPAGDSGDSAVVPAEARVLALTSMTAQAAAAVYPRAWVLSLPDAALRPPVDKITAPGKATSAAADASAWHRLRLDLVAQPAGVNSGSVATTASASSAPAPQKSPGEVSPSAPGAAAAPSAAAIGGLRDRHIGTQPGGAAGATVVSGHAAQAQQGHPRGGAARRSASTEADILGSWSAADSLGSITGPQLRDALQAALRLAEEDAAAAAGVGGKGTSGGSGAGGPGATAPAVVAASASASAPASGSGGSGVPTPRSDIEAHALMQLRGLLASYPGVIIADAPAGWSVALAPHTDASTGSASTASPAAVERRAAALRRLADALSEEAARMCGGDHGLTVTLVAGTGSGPVLPSLPTLDEASGPSEAAEHSASNGIARDSHVAGAASALLSTGSHGRVFVQDGGRIIAAGIAAMAAAPDSKPLTELFAIAGSSAMLTSTVLADTAASTAAAFASVSVGALVRALRLTALCCQRNGGHGAQAAAGGKLGQPSESAAGHGGLHCTLLVPTQAEKPAAAVAADGGIAKTAASVTQNGSSAAVSGKEQSVGKEVQLLHVPGLLASQILHSAVGPA